jgi:hypothetical protein
MAHFPSTRAFSMSGRFARTVRITRHHPDQMQNTGHLRT